MSWLDELQDPNTSRSRRLALGAFCGMFPYVCALEHETETRANRALDVTTRELGIETGDTASDVVARMARRAGDVTREPLDRLERILMWGAIGLGALVGLVLLGLLIWFVALPLMGFGGPRTVAV